MSIVIKGGYSINEVDVTGNTIGINLVDDELITGYASIVGEVDAGTVTGTKLVKPLDVSQDYRLRSGFDKIIWQDGFSHSVLNNSKYSGSSSGQTIVISGSSLSLNAGLSTIISGHSAVTTWRSFNLFTNFITFSTMYCGFSDSLQNNNVIEFGFGAAVSANTITNGVFFRASAGTLNSVVVYSGMQSTGLNIYTPVANNINKYQIFIKDTDAYFYVDDVVVSIITPSATTTVFTSTTGNLVTASGVTTTGLSLPLFLRNYNSGTPAQAVQFSATSVSVSLGDMNDGKDWATVMSTNGQNSINSPDGQVSNSTASFINSTPPSLLNLSNTTNDYSSSILGGQFAFASTGLSETDFIVFAYLNPVGTSAIPAKTLVITGVKIDTFTSGATVSTTGTTLQWSIGAGGTAIDLTTADSVTTGTRAARRLGLGMQSFAPSAAIGTLAQPIDVRLSTPLIVEDGSVCHIILKRPYEGLTTSLVYRGIININGYFE
jgi:hypothetical protein